MRGNPALEPRSMKLVSTPCLPHCTPPISGLSDLSAKSKFLVVAVAGEAGLIFAHITIPPATEGITDPDPGIFGAFQKERNARSCQHLGITSSRRHQAARTHS